MHLLSLKTKITTPRYADTLAWYRDLFGLEVVEALDEPDDKGSILAFPGGRNEALLEIYEGAAAAGFDGLSLQIRTSDLDAFCARIAELVDCRGPVDRAWGSRYAYLSDPNGIAIIVYEGGL